MGDRGSLHVNKLMDFATWLESKGWKREPTKGDFEVLRMRRPASDTPKGRSTCLLVHKKDTETQHYSLHGESSHWFTRWARERRKAKGK